METRNLVLNWAALGIAVIALFVGWNYQTNRTLDKLHAVAPPAAATPADPAVTAANVALAEARVLSAKAETELKLAETKLAEAGAEAQRAYAQSLAKPEAPKSAPAKPVAPPAYYGPGSSDYLDQTVDSEGKAYPGLRSSWQFNDKSAPGVVGKKLKPGLYKLPYGTIRQCEKLPCAPSS